MIEKINTTTTVVVSAKGVPYTISQYLQTFDWKLIEMGQVDEFTYKKTFVDTDSSVIDAELKTVKTLLA